jgi:hypothetical protein
VYKIPDFDVQRFDTLHIPIRTSGAPERAGARDASARTSTPTSRPSSTPRSRADSSRRATKLPTIDNNAYGIGSNGFGGPGYELGHGRALEQSGFELHGYRATRRASRFKDVISQYINRFIGSSSLSYRPTSWLVARLEPGVDYTARADQQLCAARHVCRRRHAPARARITTTGVPSHDDGERLRPWPPFSPRTG